MSKLSKKVMPLVLIAVLGLFVMMPPVVLADQYKVVRVLDGDTVTAAGQGGTIKIRLVGIDAPETGKKKHDPGQPFAQASKKYLTQMVLDKTITLKAYGQDRYGRVLGVLFAGEINVNLTMVAGGFAEVYRGRPPKGLLMKPYQIAESGARTEKRGMWAQGPEYVSPKDYRAQKNG